MTSAKILVAGAGIGGLSAAAALLRAGFEVEVFEQAPALVEVGAGLTLQSNAMAALRAVGLDEPVAAAGIEVRRARLASAHGRTYVDLDLSALGLDAPSIALHRAALQSILHEAVGGDRVHLGRAVRGYRREGDRVVAEVDGVPEVSGDALVGADGIHSVIRARIIGDGDPRYAGYTCWRGLTTDTGPIEVGDAFELWGVGCRLGGVHVDPDRLYWFAPVTAPPAGRDEPGGARAAVLAHYADWPADARRIIENTPEEAIVRNDIIDRPFSPAWGDGPVTLLGDAAHPMTPNMGQGACQAIEDAVVLARSLREAGGDLEAGLRAYEACRGPRARWFVERSRSIGRMGHWRNPIARAARATAMALAPRAAILRSTRRAQTFPG